MNEKNNFALVPRPPGALEKAEPGAKRILSGMVADTLALAKKEPPAKSVFSVLACSGEQGVVAAWTAIIQRHLGEAYDLTVTDGGYAPLILELVKQRPFDLIVAMVNDILVPPVGRNDRILKAVELLARLKAEYGIPVIAFSTFKPEDFDLPELLKRGGIDAFLWVPISIAEFRSALEICLKTSNPIETAARQKKTRPPRIVILDDEEAVRESHSLLLKHCYEGVEILKFGDARDAWQELSHRNPDLFITDIHHAWISCEEILSRLVERKVTFPILIISAYEKVDWRSWGPGLSVSFLTKPISLEEFRIAVETALQIPARRAP
jgi:CheY-like chemotaxis protein